MKTTILILIYFCYTVSGFSQSDKFFISIYPWDVNIGEKIVYDDFEGQFQNEVIVIDHRIYNYSFQFSYEKNIFKHHSCLLNLGYKNRDFKSLVIKDVVSQVYSRPALVRFEILDIGIGLISYFNIDQTKLFSKVGFSYGKILHKPEDNGHRKVKPILIYNDNIYNIFFGFGFSERIRSKLNVRFELNVDQSINPIIKGKTESIMSFIRGGLGIEFILD